MDSHIRRLGRKMLSGEDSEPYWIEIGRANLFYSYDTFIGPIQEVCARCGASPCVWLPDLPLDS